MRTIKFNEIIVPKKFTTTHPSEEKMNRCREYYNTCGMLDKGMLINKNNILVDGYIRYLVLAENHYNDVLKVRNNHKSPKTYITLPIPKHNAKTMYVYGKHENNDKEYVWKVPQKQLLKMAQYKIGDTMQVHTKFGKKVITITKMQELELCPVNHQVRTVICK